MIRHRFRLLLPLLALLGHGGLMAQDYNYTEPDVGSHHASSLYFVTLALNGQDVTALGLETCPHLIAAYVGNQLRGVSTPVERGPDGQALLMVRVWGDENDEPEVTFCVTHGATEYIVGKHAFAQGADAAYGSPAQPIPLSLSTPTGIALEPAAIKLRPGHAATVTWHYVPDTCSPVRDEGSIRLHWRSTSTVFTVSDNGVVTAIREGVGMLTLTVQSGSNFFQASATVTVADWKVSVTGIRNDEKDENGNETLSLHHYVGDEFQLHYTVLPEDADDKSVSCSIDDYNLLGLKTEEDGTTTLIARREGETDVTVETTDGDFSLTYHVTIEREQIDPVTLTLPAEVTLSKLWPTTITISKSPVKAMVRTKLLEFVVDEPPHGGPAWGPAATATLTSELVAGNEVAVIMQGHYAGSYRARVYYNGEPVLTDRKTEEMTLHIPAEIALSSGWQWISPYAVGPTGRIALKEGAQWLPPMQLNGIEEIRSQTGWLFNDPVEGFVGDIEALSPAEGMYKVKASFAGDDASKMVFSAGYDNLTRGSNMAQPLLHTGYTWLSYPHELDHSVAMLAPYLAATAQEGDQLIGQNGFVEFDGENWEGTDGFILESGHGYIYYTEGPGGYALNWGPYELDPETLETDEEAVAEASAYADRMNVVLQTEGQAVEAFVGGELRSLATPTESGLTYISVPGQVGEEVVFLVGGTQLSLPFAQHAGSRRAPLSIESWPNTQYRAQDVTFDLQGRRMKDSDSLRPGVYISNGRKLIVNKK